jgi:molybdopterin/thiamine biosynthesis adenylyltransferase/nitroreductase
MNNWGKCDDTVWRPVITEAGSDDYYSFELWLLSRQDVRVVNRLPFLIQEYLDILHPADRKDPDRMAGHLLDWSARNPSDKLGCWVYYPWSRTAVRLPDASIFATIRTARNKYKIDADEQAELGSRCIGIVGLSVGQSVSMALAMERSFGMLRVADFDTLELSNMNRIRTAVYNLGLSKTIIVAREIAEIDPFLKVEIWPEGIHAGNAASFVAGLDLVIDECDSLDIKVLLREKAREAGIPVLMDTSDRGMIDVERFDLEHDRPLLHGLMDGLASADLKGLTNEEKVPHILRILDVDAVSLRLRASFLEVDRSIPSWPQLASAVLTGGACTADIARRMLLGEAIPSGRYYIDPEAIVVPEPKEETIPQPRPSNPWPVLKTSSLLRSAEMCDLPRSLIPLREEEAKRITEAAVLAPSGGNIQPWHFVFERGCLLIFSDAHAGHSLLNFMQLGNWLAIGACVENAILEAAGMGIQLEVLWSFHPEDPFKPAAVLFRPQDAGAVHPYPALQQQIRLRYTDRRKGSTTAINLHAVQAADQMVREAGLKSFFSNTPESMDAMAEIVGQTDLIRLLDPWGYHDFMQEIRWNDQEARSSGDGVDIETIELTAADKAGLGLLRDPALMQFLGKRGLGSGLAKMGSDSIRNSAGVFGYWSEPSNLNPSDWMVYGRVMERLWLHFTETGIACQPCAPFFFLYHRWRAATHTDYRLSTALGKQLSNLVELLPAACGEDIRKGTPIFMFRLFDTGLPPLKRAYRRTSLPLLTRIQNAP